METVQPLPWFRRLHWQILIAMVVGTVVGLIGGEAVVPKVGWLGTLFIRLLKMVIVPLILTSIISGVAAVGGGRDLGRLFGKTMGYYVLSSALAILAGLVMVNAIRPGVGANIAGSERASIPELSTPSSPVDLLLRIVPENVVAAAAAPEPMLACAAWNCDAACCCACALRSSIFASPKTTYVSDVALLNTSG